MTEAPTDEVLPLSIGLMKDAAATGKPWEAAVMALMRAISRTRPDQPGRLNLNVVYQIGGDLFTPDFSGVRTGRFRKRDAHLMVQVGIQRREVEAHGDAAAEVVRARLFAAIDEAEAWAKKRRVANSLDDLRDIAERALADL